MAVPDEREVKKWASLGSDTNRTIRFAVAAAAGRGPVRTTEFARTMAPHPLVHQELPYEPHYTIYNRRLTAMRMGNATPPTMPTGGFAAR